MASVQVNLGIINEGISLESLDEIITSARERIIREGLRRVQIEINKERGYYDDDVEVTVALIAYRDETPEEIALKKQTQRRYDTQRREQLIRELKRLDDASTEN